MPKFELNLSSLKRNIHKFIKQIRKSLTKKNENFNTFLNDYNKQKYDPKLSLKKIKQIYLPFLKKLNLLLYFYIVKRLIYEFENPFSLNPKNKTILLLNLKNAQDILKKKPKNIKKKKKGLNPIKFSWITDFYSEEEIKNDDDKSNIFIAINITGIIYILSIFFNNQEQFENEEKYKPYELIEIGKIEANRYIKITKLKKLFETKNNSKNNYFIINSWNSAKYGRAIIINVIENNHYFDIRERYNMDIIQKIEDINGLYSSIEFFYNKKTYLLNYYQTFYLWIYNPQINQIEKTFT